MELDVDESDKIRSYFFAFNLLPLAFHLRLLTAVRQLSPRPVAVIAIAVPASIYLFIFERPSKSAPSLISMDGAVQSPNSLPED